MEKKSGTKKTAAKKTATKKKAAATTATLEAASTQTPRKARAPKTRAAGRPCKVGGCKRTYRAKGYCVAHYRQWRHGKFSKKRYTRCHDYGCNKPMAVNRHGFCEEHFQNFYVKGLEQTHAPAAPAKPAKTEKAAESAA